MSELTFVPIEPEDFQQKMHFLFKWNMEPLTAEEILQSGDALHCSACKLPRYRNWKAWEQVNVPAWFFYSGKYCRCPMKEKV